MRGQEGEREDSVTSGKASLDEALFRKGIEARGCFRHTKESVRRFFVLKQHGKTEEERREGMCKAGLK